MRRLIILISIFAILAAIVSSCAKKSPDDKILARVRNRFITLKEFKSRIAKLPPYYQNIVSKNKKRYLDEMIVETLFYEEAICKGLDRDREVKEVISEARKKILVAKFIKNEVEDKIKSSDDEMKSFYEDHKTEFKTPQLLRASHILVASEREAKDILIELSKGANFEELAKLHSMDATASRGGDVGYFKAGQLVPDFEKACFKLKVGELSDIVHTQFGYHVIKLTDKKDPAVKSYEEVKRAIESELKRKKRSESFDKLVMDMKGKYGVEIKEDVFESLDSVNRKR